MKIEIVIPFLLLALLIIASGDMQAPELCS